MAAPAREIQWSDLQRDPKSVATLADAGDVRVKRRDGVDLVLTRADRAAATDEASFAIVRALRNILFHSDPSVIAEAMVEEFPWLTYLPKDEVRQFLSDFVRTAAAAAELNQWALLAQTIREWRATAAIHADPDLRDRLATPVTEDHGPVLPPSAEA